MIGLEKVKDFIVEKLMITQKRQLRSPYDQVAHFLGAALSALFIYWLGFGRADPQHFRGIFFGVTMILGFIIFPARKDSPKDRPSSVDYLLIILCLITVTYFITEFPAMAYRMGAFTRTDLIMGLIAVGLSLEYTRRVMGPVLPALGILALIYSLEPFAPHFPGLLAHRGFSLLRVMGFLWATLDGIMGIVLNVYARYVFPFVILGKFLEFSGVGKYLIDLPYSLAGRYTGGPAKVAVVASALFGSISGSAVANTMATGTFTIPLMIKTGYRPHVAGAIEPAASTGGQFLPPVMGAAAFLMVEFIGISYLSIIMVAFLPAMIYFISVFAMVHFEAVKQSLKGLPKEELEDPLQLLKRGFYYFIPLVLLVYLLIQGYSPNYAAVWSIICCLPISWIRRETRLTPRKIYQALGRSTLDMVSVNSLAGTVGIIIAIVTLSGLMIRFPHIILSFSGDSLIGVLALAAAAAFVLGMGIPTTASYIMMAILVAPALDRFGVPLLVAHFVVFWLTQLAGLTPPVCIVAYAGAAIAKSDPFLTGFTALKFAVFLPLMPLLFVYRPAILLEGSLWEIIWTAFISTVSAVALGLGLFGRVSIWMRMVLFLGAGIMLWPGLIKDLVGLALIGSIWIYMRLLQKS
ncbi:MAG: TRAP transporter permease [Thermodesulfobacteriota bacterium]|nr:TRAP transporter permease [Thermodesulfobacteriota bacterium]